MYGCNPACAYALLGVYRVMRKPQGTIHASGRTHTALAYRIKGSSTFLFDDGEFSAKTGSVVYIPAGYNYRIRYDIEELIVVHLCCFGEDGTKIEITEGGNGVRVLFEELLQTWEAGGSACYPRCMSILYRIFEAMAKSGSDDTPELPPLILPGVSYLREHFRDPSLSISLLAEQCRISEVYFRRLFGAHFGKSPMTAILDLRFQYAENLLRSGYYPIKEIARMAGFTGTKYFRTAFTKRYGVSPSRFTDR